MPPRRHGTRQHKLFDAVDRLIEYLGPRIGATKEEMEAFFHDLQKEAFARGPQEILKKVPHAPQRLWTSTKTLHDRELCSLINETIRSDDPAILPAVAVIVRCINTLCVTRRKVAPGSAIPCPADGHVFRGGSLPDKYWAFFHPEKVGHARAASSIEGGSPGF